MGKVKIKQEGTKMSKYKVYAENIEGKRRFISYAIADRGGRGLFDLYASECGDEEEIVIIEETGKE
jgi:hypothetical protein